MDKADIKSGVFWDIAIGQQIETVKSAAVFVGQHGVGPWQHREIIALLDQFDRRGCPVIPVILPSEPSKPVVLPWSLASLHCVDFRTDSVPLQRLIWGITGQKPVELADVPDSEKPATMQDAAKPRLIAGRDGEVRSHNVISESRLYPLLAEPPDRDNATQLTPYYSAIAAGGGNNWASMLAACHKKKNWDYEREWRIIFPFVYRDGKNNFSIPIKSITAGLRADSKVQERLFEIAQKLQVPLYKTFKSRTEANLFFEPIT